MNDFKFKDAENDFTLSVQMLCGAYVYFIHLR